MQQPLAKRNRAQSQLPGQAARPAPMAQGRRLPEPPSAQPGRPCPGFPGTVPTSNIPLPPQLPFSGVIGACPAEMHPVSLWSPLPLPPASLSSKWPIMPEWSLCHCIAVEHLKLVNVSSDVLSPWRDWGVAHWESACLACARPLVHPQHQKSKQNH